MLSIMDEGTIRTPNPKCRLYWRLIEFMDWRYSHSCWYFRSLLWTVAPLPSLWPPPPHPPSRMWGGWAWGVLSCIVDHILQEFHTLFLKIFRTYKIATPPQPKTPVKTTFMDWCLYSSFIHAFYYLGGKGWAAGAALPAVSTCPAQRRPPARQQGCGGPLTTPTTSYPVLIHLRRGGSHDSPPQAQSGNSGRKNALSPCTELKLTMQMGSSVRKKCCLRLKSLVFRTLIKYLVEQ